MKKLLIIILLMFSTCFANGIPHLYILHVNGIGTTDIQAQGNMRKLKDSLPENLLRSNMLTVDYVWNPTGNKSFWTNLADVMGQKAHEWDKAMTLDDFTEFWMSENDLHYAKDSPEYAKLKSEITNNYADMLKEEAGDNMESVINHFHDKVPTEFAGVVNLLNTPYTPRLTSGMHSINDSNPNTTSTNPQQDEQQAKDLQDALDNYLANHPKLRSNRDYKDTKNLVLFVPHSQGNLYTNSLYYYLANAENFPVTQMAIYGVASPADSNDGDWIAKALDTQTIRNTWGMINSYTTSDHDFVVNSARVLFPFNNILPANGFPPSAPSIGHSFESVYLSDPEMSKQIIKMITLEATELIKTMNTKLTHFDLAMWTYMFPAAFYNQNSTIRQGADNILCDVIINNCANSVLSFPTLRSDYSINRMELYFPQSTFGGNKEYFFFKPRMLWTDGAGAGMRTQINLATPLPYATNTLSCSSSTSTYNGCMDMSIRSNGTSFMTGYAVGYTAMDLSQALINYPSYYERDKLIAAKFTLP